MTTPEDQQGADAQAASGDFDPVIAVREMAASARARGIELDESETLRWLAAMAIGGEDLVVDAGSGVFGHRISMLDFSPRELERFRRIGRIVEVTGPDGVAESALALSGSAAQSKIQSYPGDCDYFQRLNIRADTRDEACRILGELMREKARAFDRGDGYQFIEGKLGSYPASGEHAGAPVRAGAPVSWTPEEIAEGVLHWTSADGREQVIRWEDAAQDPGWCKLDWVVADPDRVRLANASNVIDVTWEAPDGAIVPLDGYLDAYFQEVYLDADAVPTFVKVVAHVSDDALDDYVDALEGEVRKYLTKNLNYGKAAKRMYNLFRLSGRHLDAAFVRELFDEPATMLYQVWSLISTLDNATRPDSAIPIEQVRTQADELVVEVARALEGDVEIEIVDALLALRRTLESKADLVTRTAEIEGARTRVVNVVNGFFKEKLESVPTIRAYIQEVQAGAAG
ncbi:hypothetical protein [Microbacterium thalassium]|uniref:DNA-binding response OmpR family regulator n=1 Tax=Microbacterium thalassium TaxID=362649 RepID=A0A7X0FRU3_9MICO|nr:hypothetical protein [Microbacterium thalassium]MBB6392543.1 DNA-binding response OmpR family regulator [Microbacterium thalassium]GLK23226.1 hypothetical protein GCM10017607_05440 [Microbacterium thalassium]